MENHHLSQLSKPTLTWMPPEGSSTGLVCIRTRHLTADRVVAAGVDSQQLALTADNWQARGALSKQVRRRERSKEDAVRAQREKAVEARRKRVRRVNFEKEDRDALRKVARSHDDGTRLPLEATPGGLRETAIDGTPHSAKAAGAKLRKLTQTFYERLMDPRFYGVTENELADVMVETEFWDSRTQDRDSSAAGHGEWDWGLRRLKRYGGSIGKWKILWSGCSDSDFAAAAALYNV
jgi:hypothetical protein